MITHKDLLLIGAVVLQLLTAHGHPLDTWTMVSAGSDVTLTTVFFEGEQFFAAGCDGSGGVMLRAKSDSTTKCRSPQT